MSSNPPASGLYRYRWYKRLWLWSAMNPGWSFLLGLETGLVGLAILTSYGGFFEAFEEVSLQMLTIYGFCILAVLMLTCNVLEAASYVMLGIVPPEGVKELRYVEI